MSTQRPISSTPPSITPPVPTPPPEPVRVEPSIAFKILRLYRPTFEFQSVVVTEPTDAVTTDRSTGAQFAESEFGLNEDVRLPDDLPAVYLGQTFKGMVSVCNTSPYELKYITFYVAIQSGSELVRILDISASPIEKLDVHDNVPYIIEWEVKEPGLHQIICVANWTDPLDMDGRRLEHLQRFKFTATVPVILRSRSRILDSSIMAEAFVQNATDFHLYLENVRLDPAPLISRVDLDPQLLVAISGTGGSKFFNPLMCLKPKESRQFLYMLHQTTSTTRETDKAGSTVLGKFEAHWRTSNGESGRAWTQIVHKRVEKSNVELQVREIKGELRAGQPFIVACRAVNCSARSITLKLHLKKDESMAILPCGISGTILCTDLEPRLFVDFEVEMFALCAGHQDLSGIQVVDCATQLTYDISQKAYLLIQNANQ